MGISTYAQNIIDEKDALIGELVKQLEAARDIFCNMQCGDLNDDDHWEECSNMTAALARAKQEMGDAD